MKFPARWLRREGLNPDMCRIIRVVGESMEPTLPDGCSILVNHEKRKPADGRIFVIRTEDELIVKRTLYSKGTRLAAGQRQRGRALVADAAVAGGHHSRRRRAVGLVQPAVEGAKLRQEAQEPTDRMTAGNSVRRNPTTTATLADLAVVAGGRATVSDPQSGGGIGNRDVEGPDAGRVGVDIGCRMTAVDRFAHDSGRARRVLHPIQDRLRRAAASSRGSGPAAGNREGQGKRTGGRPQRGCATLSFGYNAWNLTVRKSAGGGIQQLDRTGSAAASSGRTGSKA